MEIKYDQLRVLLTHLYDRDDEQFTIAHPTDEIGDLIRVAQGSHDDCTVQFLQRRED